MCNWGTNKTVIPLLKASKEDKIMKKSEKTYRVLSCIYDL